MGDKKLGSYELFTWRFTPHGFFSESFEIVSDKYEVHMRHPGTVEARICSNVFLADPALRSTIDEVVKARFFARQFVEFKQFELRGPFRNTIHPDGRKDIYLECSSMTSKSTISMVDIRYTDANGIVHDTKADRREREGTLARLLAINMARNPTLSAMVASMTNAVDDPKNLFVHLYEIREAVALIFGHAKNAQAHLGVSSQDWSKLGVLANELPLKQGRHRGKMKVPLRDATEGERLEAKRIASSMITAYIHYLNAKNSSVVVLAGTN